MAYNINDVIASSSKGSKLASLYPPTKTEGDVITMTGFLEGVGFEAFTFEQAGYAKLSVFKEIEGTDDRRSYSCLIGNFFTNEARISINCSNILNFFKAFEPNPDMSKFPEFDSLEEFVNAFNTVFNIPQVMNPDVKAKIVFRSDLGETAQYNLSKNFPNVELKSMNKMKFEKPNQQYGDITIFNKTEFATDNMLGGNDSMVGNDNAPVLSLPDSNLLL